MSVQETLRLAGILSCLVAAVLVVLSVHAFVSQDIPGVLDDLSGRKRQRELALPAPLPEHQDLFMTRGARDSRADVLAHDVATELAESAFESAQTQVDELLFDVVLSIVLCDQTVLQRGKGGTYEALGQC